MTDPHNISGRWTGTFKFFASQDIGEWPFKARLAVNGDRVTGIVVEPHLSGNGDIKADLEGAVDGRSISFSKRYISESEDYIREVQYDGLAADDGLSITGTWRHSDNSGEFRMDKIV